MAITKNIGYAYPTSPLAKELGYNQTGCYYVAVYDDSRAITRHDVCCVAFDKAAVIAMVPSFAGKHVAWGEYSMYKGY